MGEGELSSGNRVGLENGDVHLMTVPNFHMVIKLFSIFAPGLDYEILLARTGLISLCISNITYRN